MMTSGSPHSVAKRLLPFVLCFSLILIGVYLQPAHAAGTVTNCSAYSAGAGSLEAALSGGGTVTFNCSGTITVPEITINNSVTIDATGYTVALDGGGANQIFSVTSSGNLTLNSVTIQNGNHPFAGGIYNVGGTVTLNNSTVSGNHSTVGGGIRNWNNGTVTLYNSTVSGNSATGGGGIYNSSTLNIIGSTISGNSATAGGGIENASGGTLNIISSTISGNSATGGGGIHNNGVITLSDSDIVSNSSGTTGGGIYNSGGTITFDGVTNVSGNTVAGGAIHNLGTLITNSGSNFINENRIENDGTITNNGTISNNSTIINNGSITNNGTIENACTGVITGAPVSGNPPVGTCATTTMLTSSLNPSQEGDAVTFTATITFASSSTPTGTITFSIDGIPQPPVTVNGSGQGSLTTGSLSVGAHTIEATYSGDTIFAPSATAPLMQTVNVVTAPEILVFQGGFTPISNDVGSATFVGTAGTPIVSIIEIRNTGTADLTLTEPITLNGAGFTLLSSFGSTTVTPSGSTTFELQCDAAAEGAYTGSVSFGNNDADDNPFTFALDCQVSAAPVTPTQTPTPTQTLAPTLAPTATATFPPPPPPPLCETHNFAEDGVVRANTIDDIDYAVNCRVLYQNGQPTQWLGGDLYNAGSIGIEGVLNLGVQQAVDIFSPVGMTYFNGGAVFCLRGQGTLIWLAASRIPRHAEIIGSYTVPDFPGFTCATLFEPGTLVLVRDNPVTNEA